MPLSKSLAELLGIKLVSDADVCENSPYLLSVVRYEKLKKKG